MLTHQKKKKGSAMFHADGARSAVSAVSNTNSCQLYVHADI
jgi:hypothetical protein